MTTTLLQSDFAGRAAKLGMSLKDIADRSGVSYRTVVRVVKDANAGASFEVVSRIATVLGLELIAAAPLDAQSMREQQAEKKANELVAMVQGNSALEDQAVDEQTLRRMREKAKQQLLASKRKLWAT